MHYYKFNVASWAKDTSHLSLKEEAIYLRLINFYYDNEKPIPLKTHLVLRKLRMADESETVELILEEFFHKTKNGWIHNHCEKLISEYQKMAERNKRNGKSGGRPKINNLEKPTGIQGETNSEPNDNPNQELLTNNQEPENKNKEQRIEDAFNKFWISYHKKQGKAQALKAFKAAVKREGIKDFEEFSEMLITDCKERLSSKQFGFDNLNGATYLNNNRWEDEKASNQESVESYVKPDWMRGIK
ncbi:hypothetical protein ValSw33_44 [Vibrio phage ValSw3-3]|nr:hypothetical protein ValSw33_44 [Vibrio phage ValSw3-3]